MPEPWTRRRLGWPGLAVLVLVFAGALTWLILSEQRHAPNDVIPRGPYVGALPEVVPQAREDASVPATVFSAGPRAADPTGRDAVYDPHRSASEAHYPEGGDGGVGAPFAALVEVGRVAASTGAPAVDTPCEVRVLPVHRATFNCVARVLCAGEVLYPNASQSTGYLACEIRDGAVHGASDREEGDGDPQLELDVPSRRAVVEEDGRRIRVVW